MKAGNRPLTKRPRASLACNSCRTTKSKCDGARPTCDRCARCSLDCEYTESSRDRRMDRQEERRAHLALANKVRDLESQLAAAKSQTQGTDTTAISPASHDSRGSFPARMTDLHPGAGDSGSTVGAQPASESTADAIATGLFDDQPSNADIGYFGASSNHAFFWTLTAAIEQLGNKNPTRYRVPSRKTGTQEGLSRLPLPSLKAAAARQNESGQEYSFPGREIAVDYVNRFFDTVAVMFPYVDKSALLRYVDIIDSQTGTWQSSSPSTQALLNVVFAYALSTSEDGAAEPFYRQALSLLDEQGLYLPNIESLQALLLLASFQQNSQRAMESITTHFRAVKAAYQLGVHSPSSYEQLGALDREQRSRIWFAVVNQDRMIGSGLGRPLLVPALHVRRPLMDMMVSGPKQRAKVRQQQDQNLQYFRHLTSLHEVMGDAVDTMYSSNISSSHDLSLPDLITLAIGLVQKVDSVRENARSNSRLLPIVNPQSWTEADFEANRHVVLLNLFSYRTLMLINAPLLLAVLHSIANLENNSTISVHLRVGMSMLHTYYQTINDFHELLNTILSNSRSFLRRNAVWWPCNYIMVSINLHLFGFWLVAVNQGNNVPTLGTSGSEVEALMRHTLDTLKLVGGSSIMSRKAHRSLQRYLDLLTSAERSAMVTQQMGTVAPTTASAPTIAWLASDAALPSSDIGMWDNNMDDLLAGMGPDDFLGNDLFAMGYSISDFDATGFI